MSPALIFGYGFASGVVFLVAVLLVIEITAQKKELRKTIKHEGPKVEGLPPLQRAWPVEQEAVWHVAPGASLVIEGRVITNMGDSGCHIKLGQTK